MTRVRSGERDSPLSLACTGCLEQGVLPKAEVMEVGGVPAVVNLNCRTLRALAESGQSFPDGPGPLPGLWGKVSPGWVATSGCHFTEASVVGDAVP